MLRVAGLVATLAALAFLAALTHWYATITICAAAALAQAVLLARYAARAGREVGRFLDAVAYDDTTTSFTGLARNAGLAELAAAMTRVMEQLRRSRAEREEQSQYLQNLISHIPVALITVDEEGGVRLLNLAARRLFGTSCPRIADFARHGAGFAIGLESLKPGETSIVPMERPGGALQLKAGATDVVLKGARQRLISLQNIETELSAKELMAWQTVIRVMAHEVMNSLTPISSLASTARDNVADALLLIAPDDPARTALGDAAEALETLSRRSDGLLHFVENHRRLTRRLAAQVRIVPVRRVFTRIHRLLADELQARDIAIATHVDPETLEVTADPDLLDQALINLLRNAIEALRDTPDARITLSAAAQTGGRASITVTDNGPGIAADEREKVFVPFYTTKRQGSGVGLTLVRQIAAVHGATVAISDTPGGGATVQITFC
ncbi:MAG: GHKL domain-containing protein [Alphaproteobacteria bacterium]|nr:GHKL domain-containing protein [Alphaproteobacteria bacterium]